MAAKRAAARAFWVFLAVHAVAANSGAALGAGWSRDRACLAGAAPHAPRNLTVNGIAGPLKLGAGDWMAAKILGWMAKILVEEVFGVSAELRWWPSSFVMIHAVSACQDPANTTNEKCDVPGPPLADAVIAVWKTAGGDGALEWLKTAHPAQYPIHLGSVGYSGQNVFFVKESSTQPAMQQDHLPLQYYLSYSHPRVDVSSYFDSVLNISSGDLAPCARTQMDNALYAASYLAVTGDAAGVNTEGNKLRCTNSHWWIAPSCRADLTKCIPFITGGDGWYLDFAVQRATKWGMPLAVATAKDWNTYVALPKAYRLLASWWVPDQTFLDVNPIVLTFPKYDPAMQAEGKLFNSFPENPISKLGFSGMANRSNEGGTTRILELIRNLQVSEQEILALMRLATAKPAGVDGIAQTACEWLNANPNRWKAWIPVETNCLDGKGLVSEQGDFVQNRSMARRCSWCSPGRVSVELTDLLGRTYFCKECDEGTSQSDVGATECDRCTAGTAAPRKGMASCARCGVTEYTAAAGAVQCQSCPEGFITPYEGAQSEDACICPEGKYRDGLRRDLCLDCKVGMVCAAGSDALGFLPEEAARYPIAPLLKPGFWSSAAEPLSVFRCEVEIRCPGGRAPGSACFGRLEGQACQHCVEGYVWDGLKCKQCKAKAAAYVVFPLLPAVLLPAVVIGVYRFFGDEYRDWGKWQNGVTAMLYVLLHHYHLMNILHRTDTAFTERAGSAMRAFSWTSDVWSFFQIGCYGFQAFSRKMILQSLGPMLLILAYVITWGTSQLIGMRFPAVKMDINRTISCLLSLILTFFTGIADMALTIFKCASNPNGKHTLASDRSTVCFEGEWNAMLAVGIASGLVWCVGTMLIFIYAIWSAPRNFHRRDVQARWKFLFIRYRADVHWWALVIVTKSIVVNLGCIVLTTGVGQITWILATLVVYTHAVSVYRPWRTVLNNTWDIDLNLSLVVACAAMFCFAARDSDANIPAAYRLGEVLVQVSNYTPVAACAPVAAAIYWRSSSSWARSKKEQDITVLVNAVHLLAKEGSGLERFLHALPETDWLTMVSAKDIVQTELAARRIRSGYSSRQLSRLCMDEIAKEQEEQRKSARLKEFADNDEFLPPGNERNHTPVLQIEQSRWGVSTAPRAPSVAPTV